MLRRWKNRAKANHGDINFRFQWDAKVQLVARATAVPQSCRRGGNKISVVIRISTEYCTQSCKSFVTEGRV